MNGFTRSRLAVSILTTSAFALLVSAAGAFAAPGASGRPSKTSDDVTRNKKAFFDSRQTPAALNVLHGRAAALDDNPAAATSNLKSSLGVEGFVTLDPLTGTVREAGRTDGFLTQPSDAAAASIALDFVTTNASALGLTSEGLQSLSLANDYVSLDGTHHLSYVQKIGGIPVFDNGLKVNVTKDGRVINVVGSPLADAATQTSSPNLSAGDAMSQARVDVGLQTGPFLSDSASPVYFRTVDGTRIAYETSVGTGTQTYQSIVDAQTGKILYRRSLVDYANGLVFDYYPGAANGGTAHTVDLTQNGWLSGSATTLSGPNAHEYSDVNDNNQPDSGEETVPGSYTLSPFTPTACVPTFVCSWDPSVANSWQTNEAQSAVQLFYFVNNWHDHLAAAPIGFTQAAGNFQGNDPVLAENLDGANTASGLPDGNHIDNANFATPPDGQSGRMQMFLWHQPGAAFPGQDPFIAAMGSDEADIVYHENTHGLSNRLVVDAQGNSTLGGGQAGAMGEAWSDWYAMDYLVDQGLQTDTSADGEVRIGNYVGWGNDLIRTQPIDCPVGSTSTSCPGGATGHSGGYTYGDYGHIIPQVEVHADGEIWGETLWDLRNAVGSQTAEDLVTRAMELSPFNPSMLDERNSILQADQVDFGGSHHDTIWSVFAHRGMGYFAGSLSGDDSRPVQDFSTPPAPGTPSGKLKGTVTDKDTGKPVQGVVVAFGGHASGFPGDFAGTSKGNGTYEVKKIVFGTYPDVSASGAGYDTVVVPNKVTINAPITSLDFQLRRDWASLGGGASVQAFTGPDFSNFGCGPSSAIDQSLGNGWGSVTNSRGVDDGTVNPESVTVQLPVAISISEVQIDPSNTCGDPGSSATHHYTVETSPDGHAFTLLNEGHFFAANRGHLNTVTPLAAGASSNVRFIRFTMINPMVPDTGAACTDASNCDDNGVAERCGPANESQPGATLFGGCTFMDMSEIEVFGSPS
jgi:extracellular elastinolytic metalloproteinase